MRELIILKQLIFEYYLMSGNIQSTLFALYHLLLVQQFSSKICPLFPGKLQLNMAIQPGLHFPGLPAPGEGRCLQPSQTEGEQQQLHSEPYWGAGFFHACSFPLSCWLSCNSLKIHELLSDLAPKPATNPEHLS